MANCITEEPQPHSWARQCQDKAEERQQIATYFAQRMQ